LEVLKTLFINPLCKILKVTKESNQVMFPESISMK